MYCPNCGNLIQEGERFCGSCGARIEPPAAAAVPQQPVERQAEPALENRIPYREEVEQNLEAARRAQRKSGPLTMIACLVIGALFGGDAFLLLSKKGGLYLRFIGVEVTAIACILMAALMLFLVVFFLINTLKNCGKKITEKRFERFMDEVRAIGPENEVFARIDRLTPLTFGKSELRFDEALITCTSASDPDVTFVAPLSELAEAGLAVVGSKGSATTSLYLHVMQNGRKRKISSTADQAQILNVLTKLRALRPDLKIMNAGKPM